MFSYKDIDKRVYKTNSFFGYLLVVNPWTSLSMGASSYFKEKGAVHFILFCAKYTGQILGHCELFWNYVQMLKQVVVEFKSKLKRMNASQQMTQVWQEYPPEWVASLSYIVQMLTTRGATSSKTRDFTCLGKNHNQCLSVAHGDKASILELHNFLHYLRIL